MSIEEPFEQDIVPSIGEGALVVDLDGYEGPLDVLLALAREQKVDLKRISILQLAEQYLAFIAAAHRIELEVAADYLVMAAWLAYLKSRLLLPEPPDDDEPTGEEMAARLALQLRRLEAMRQAGSKLMSLNRMGQDLFARGNPEGITVIRNSVYQLSLYELLKAYSDHRVSRGSPEPLRMRRSMVFSVEDALIRLSETLGRMPDWSLLVNYLPPNIVDAFGLRSAMASTFVASLELSRQGRMQLRQGQTFGPIYVRKQTGPTEAS
ncbi:MAG TPA: ScpA family protein [Candidatus Cybelea sp.]|nr:ScpA family protein [Candidatus Cybelea sp.]